MKTMSDEELIQLYCRHQLPIHFNELYARHYPSVLRHCESFTNDQDCAADITQDIFLKLIGKLTSFAGKSKFSTWLHVVTHHHCLDRTRAQKRKQGLYGEANWYELALTAVDTCPDLWDDADRQFDWCWLQLAPKEQRLLRMKYMEGRSMIDMAHILGLSIPAIKMQLKRSRDKFRIYYQNSYWVA